MAAAFVPDDSPSDVHVKRVLEVVGKIHKNKRPRQRKSLVALASTLLPKLSVVQVQAIVSRLETEGKISIENDRVTTYRF